MRSSFSPKNFSHRASFPGSVESSEREWIPVHHRRKSTRLRPQEDDGEAGRGRPATRMDHVGSIRSLDVLSSSGWHEKSVSSF